MRWNRRMGERGGEEAAPGGARGVVLAGLLVALAAATAVGCDSLGGGAAFSEIRVHPERQAGTGAELPAGELQGEVEVRLQVILGGGIGFPLSISGGNRTVRFDLAGDTAISLGRLSTSPGIYQGLRVIFTQATAEVTAGLPHPVPGGSGTVTVAFPAGGSEPLGPEGSIILRDGDDLDVSIELRASEWIPMAQATPPSGGLVVPGSSFREKVRVEVRVR